MKNPVQMLYNSIINAFCYFYEKQYSFARNEETVFVVVGVAVTHKCHQKILKYETSVTKHVIYHHFKLFSYSLNACENLGFAL